MWLVGKDVLNPVSTNNHTYMFLQNVTLFIVNVNPSNHALELSATLQYPICCSNIIVAARYTRSKHKTNSGLFRKRSVPSKQKNPDVSWPYIWPLYIQKKSV